MPAPIETRPQGYDPASFDSRAESEYIRSLDKRLTDLSPDDGPRSLSAYLQASQGAFPSLVLDRLRALSISWTIAKDDTFPISVEHPELHPIDYEWLFDEAGVNVLKTWIDGRSSILVGLPTLANLVEDFTLIERNPFVLIRSRHLQQKGAVVIDDIGSIDPARIHPKEVVAFDPPWYLGETLLWLSQAARMVLLGGHIAFSLFQAGLRQKAVAERDTILNYAESLGPVTILPGALSYSTPLFEIEALRASGCPTLVNWRRGDLVIIRVDRDPSSIKPPSVAPLAREEWLSYRLNSQVVKVRVPPVSEKTGHSSNKAFIRQISGLTDWRYPTVSLRDRSRGEIDVWTSRNRVAKLESYLEVDRLLLDLSKSPEPARLFNRAFWMKHPKEAADWMSLLDLNNA